MMRVLISLFCLALIACGNVSSADQGANLVTYPSEKGKAQSQAETEIKLVKDGKPNAQIIIVSKNRSRMTTLAALELRRGIEKMSGARLPIVTSASESQQVKIYVGKSPETEKLGIKDEGLAYGAYRMVSGPDWMVLLGKDIDFDSNKYPGPLSRNDEGAKLKWDKAVKDSGLTDSEWESPFKSLFKRFWAPKNFETVLNQHYGERAFALWMSGGNEVKGFWEFDQSGSLNAVYEFLRTQGVRWFMPGDLGEILPKTNAIQVGPVNKTVKPDYPVRSYTWCSYGAFDFDDVLWARRIGMNSGFEYLGFKVVHGLTKVYGTEAMHKAHPEYFALIQGTRDTESNHGRGTPCFSSKGLEQETIHYIRFLYDTYDLPSVDIWPGDGLRNCPCKECNGKTPSELVWEFANRVAIAVYKSHPDKRLTCGAYTSYSLAPDTIKQFSPNLSVWIANAGRPKIMDPEHFERYWTRVQKWQDKIAPGGVLRSENNRYHVWGIHDGVRGRPISYPAIHPRSMARELKALKGISSGEIGEQSQLTGSWKRMGLEHIHLYVQSRFLWNADLDVDQVLDEYCSMFYGPAASQMKDVIDFAESNIAVNDLSKGRGRGNLMNVSLEVALKLRDLLNKAETVAGDTVYRKRVQRVMADLQPREELIQEYQEKEVEVVTARKRAPLALGIEGVDLANAPSYKLKPARGRTDGIPQTSFKVGWNKGTLFIEVVCQEPDMKNLKVSDDVFKDDYVAISLDTQNYTYYHVQINPDGTIMEGNPTRGWSSLADVKTERGADFWRVQLSLRVVDEDEAQADPNHRVTGSKPTKENPWYFNVGRQRCAGLEEPELQFFSQTGTNWHLPAKFARLEINAQ
ncbi:MAG: hypothetical protein ACI9QL_003734 [Candidatus Omnitrophota bacterium]|jgi:hypothetical protein